MEPQTYAFGRFRIEVASRQLLRDGAHVPLPAEAFDALLVLVRRRDRMVTKDELMRAVWPDTLVADDSLTQSISSLRRAFGDAEVISAIPRRGYRFIAPVSENPPPDWDELRAGGAGSGIGDPGSEIAGWTPAEAPESRSVGSRIPDSGSPIPTPRLPAPHPKWLMVALVLAALAALFFVACVLRAPRAGDLVRAPPVVHEHARIEYGRRDAIPGVIQPVWFTPVQTGEWRIVCSHLCGLGHYRMRGFYTIQAQAGYDAWLG